MKLTTALLLLDAAINLALGVLLVAFPAAIVDFLGLPQAIPPFYPSLLGGVLFGIGLALLIGCRNSSGLGLTGALSINLCGGLVLTWWLVSGSLNLTSAGHALLWFLVVALVGLSIFELWGQRRTPGGRK